MSRLSSCQTIAFGGDASLAALREALRPFGPRALGIDYGGRAIQPGYHVTEVKAGSFVTLDCGGKPDSWRETVLQVEDLPASASTASPMSVEKFLGIIERVGQRLPLDEAARLTFEVGPPGLPMQVFDLAALVVTGPSAVLRLCARPAICKPRHRAERQPMAACCRPRG